MKFDLLKRLHSGAIRSLGGVPRDIYRSVYKRMVMAERNDKSSLLIDSSTITRFQFYDGSQKLFLLLRDADGDDRRALKHALYQYIKEYQRDSFPGMDLYRSAGTEGGTMKVSQTSFRVKRFPSSEQARIAVKLNNIVEEHFPGSTVFTTDIGEYVVSEDFDGEPLCKAPIETIMSYVETVARLMKVPTGIEQEREHYGHKILDQIIPSLQERYNIREETINEFTVLAYDQYLRNASVPFWDMNPANGNVKYADGVVKLFDFTKARTLVLPLYDLVQLVLECDETYYDELKAKARHASKEILGMGDEDFNHFWELGSIYFLTRQIRNRTDEESASYYEKRLVQHESDNTLGNMLRYDIMCQQGRIIVP